MAAKKSSKKPAAEPEVKVEVQVMVSDSNREKVESDYEKHLKFAKFKKSLQEETK